MNYSSPLTYLMILWSLKSERLSYFGCC